MRSGLLLDDSRAGGIDLYGMRGGSVRSIDGHCDVHGLRSGPVSDIDRCIFVDELHGLRNGTIFGRYGPGRCLQHMLGRSVRIERRAHSLHNLCFG